MNRNDFPKCPECGSRMTKAGAGISGRKEYQSYRCTNRACLRTWLNTKEVYVKKQFRSKVVQRK